MSRTWRPPTPRPIGASGESDSCHVSGTTTGASLRAVVVRGRPGYSPRAGTGALVLDVGDDLHAQAPTTFRLMSVDEEDFLLYLRATGAYSVEVR